MRVGLDFDNTIVGYDRVFFAAARELDLVPDGLPRTKLGVRDHLRAAGNEDAWTELQGYVYGMRMADARPFPGVLDALKALRHGGCELFIVSHKTRYPYRGPACDLHAAATEWIETVLIDKDGPLVPPDHVSFHGEKAGKIAHIGALGCDAFVDDLPEILTAADFPGETRRILFDPDGRHEARPGIARMGAWHEAGPLILEGRHDG